MDAEALDGAAVAAGASDGKHVPELGARVVVERLQAARLEALDVLVERVDEHPERQVALQLGGAPGEHELPPLVRARGQLAEQAGLADPGLADQFQGSRAAPPEPVERLVERRQLGGAPDEVLGKRGHVPVRAEHNPDGDLRVANRGALLM